MRLNHLARDDRGMSFVFVGVTFTTFMAARAADAFPVYPLVY
jgi:hypothetical protein